jgi:hypothetical protein
MNTDHAEMTRSADGTPIAYERHGEDGPLVLVDGLITFIADEDPS